MSEIVFLDTTIQIRRKYAYTSNVRHLEPIAAAIGKRVLPI